MAHVLAFTRPNWLVLGEVNTYVVPGVDVMIIIFCDFLQFLAKNWGFSQKPML
jgi:hypothetical protein